MCPRSSILLVAKFFFLPSGEILKHLSVTSQSIVRSEAQTYIFFYAKNKIEFIVFHHLVHFLQHFPFGWSKSYFKFYFFFFGQEGRIYWWAWLRWGQPQNSHECRAHHLSRGPQLRLYLTSQPSGMSCFSATIFSNSSTLNLVNPHFLEMWIF